MTTLVIAEHDNAKVAAATLNTVGAAARLGADVHVLVAGSGCTAAAEAAASIRGVSRALQVDGPHYSDHGPENLAILAVQLAESYQHVLFPATTFGKNLAPRVAALLDVAQISDIVDIVDADTFVRPIYAGNALTTVRSADRIKVATVRPTAFESPGIGGQAQVQTLAAGPDVGLSALVLRNLTKSERPELAAARIVVSGGRGCGSAENYRTLLGPLADKLSAALGASRAAVDAGYVPNDLQVGQTGKIVAPDLYLAVGISGAIQHLAGMKDSKVIVAINKDPDAPIFQIADYGWVADIFTAVPELVAELSRR